MGSFVKNRKILRFLTVLFSSAIISNSGLAFAAKKIEDPYIKAAKERENQNIKEEENYINWKKPSKYLARMVRNKLTSKYILKFLICLITIVSISSSGLATSKRKFYDENNRKIKNENIIEKLKLGEKNSK